MSINPSDESKIHRSGLGIGYANNEFYLPIAGCPSVSELEPKLTSQLTLKGNKAKLLHIPLWHHTYYTSSYLIDDVTGELYACHQGELIAIKEQGYLQKEMAKEEYLSSRGKEGVVYLEQEKNTQTQGGLVKESLKIPQLRVKSEQGTNTGKKVDKFSHNELEQQNKNTIEAATGLLQEYQGDAHKQAVAQWNLKRRERKQLEKDLLKYQVDGTVGRTPTDQEVEQARMYINDEHTKKLKEELPYIAQYFEKIPADTGINENDGLSESSAGSYEAREEWTEQDYRKLMINFNRNEAQYEVDRMVTELAIQRDPENLAAIEEEYSKGRELLGHRQKRGHDLLKVAGAYVDYTRRQERFREGIHQEEIGRLQEQLEKVNDTQWRSREEQLQKETLQVMQRKENEWEEKVQKQTEMTKQLEAQCKDLKALESKRLTELKNQLQEKQLESERVWSELTNTWAAERITKDSKIDELRTALETANEQKLMAEQNWKTTLETERLEKLDHVNKLLERVKKMEVKQGEIKQDMEQKLKRVQETAQEKFQKSINQMQEEYQYKLEQEVQRRSFEQAQGEKMKSTVNKAEEKLNSQQTAIETVKRMLHQGQGKTESPEMEWDYYGDQSQIIGPTPPYERGVQGPGKEKRIERNQIPERAASTPMEEELYP